MHALGQDSEVLFFASHWILPQVHLGIIFLAHTLGVELRVGVVGIFCAAHCSHGMYREVGENLVRNCHFETIVLTAHLAHGKVCESEVGIVVERRLLDAIDETCIVGIDLTYQSLTHLEHPCRLTAQYRLELQVLDVVILHTRGHESITDERSFLLGTSGYRQALSCDGGPSQLHLAATAHEACPTAFAVRVVMIAAILLLHLSLAVLHLAVALHLCTLQISAHVEIPWTALHAILCPQLGHINVGVVVVAKLVALLHLAVGVTHVALCLHGIAAVVVDGILIDIGEERATQQIVHRLVVHADGMVQIGTSQQFLTAANGVRPRARQCPDKLVVVATLHIVECIAARQRILLVDHIHSIPVDLTIGLRRGPEVVECGPLLLGLWIGRLPLRAQLFGVIDIEDARRQILVVVGTRVVGIASPTHRRRTVVRILERRCRHQLVRLVGLPIPSSNKRGLEVLHNTRIALLAVLIAPVGVIIVTVGQPIDLLGRSTLLCTLGGRTEGRNRECMCVPAFFGAEIIGEGIVECAFNHTLVGPTIAKRACKGPSVGFHTSADGVDGSCLVVAVASRECELLPSGNVRGTQVDVVAATDTGDAERVVLKSRRTFLLSRQVVQTAQEAIVIASLFEVVELQTIEECGGIHVVEGSHPETHGTPPEANLRKIGVIVRRGNVRDCLSGINIIIELRLGEREVAAVILFLCRLRFRERRAGDVLWRRLRHQSHHDQSPGRSCQCYYFAHDIVKLWLSFSDRSMPMCQPA